MVDQLRSDKQLTVKYGPTDKQGWETGMCK